LISDAVKQPPKISPERERALSGCFLLQKKIFNDLCALKVEKSHLTGYI